MKIKLPSKIINLAKIFKKNGHTLYVVGGFVRDSLLSKKPLDVDVVSNALVDDVMGMLEGTTYKAEIKNAKFGTVEIVSEGLKVCEYTTLRREIYKNKGSHSPSEVEFVSTIGEDSLRRDFSINAIYLNILKAEILDPQNGLSDLKKKLIKSVSSTTMLYDGERILRMAKLKGQTGFKIEKKTFESACHNLDNLSCISSDLKLQNLRKILSLNTARQVCQSLGVLNKLRIFDLLNLNDESIKFMLVRKVEKEERELAFFVDAVASYKPESIEEYLDYVLGASGYKFSKSEIFRYENIVSGYFSALNNLENKKFFFKYFNNFKIISKLIAYKSKKIQNKYNFFYNYLLNNKIPITTGDLSIKSSDIKKHYPRIPSGRYDFILTELLSKVFDGVLKNETESLLLEVKHYDYK